MGFHYLIGIRSVINSYSNTSYTTFESCNYHIHVLKENKYLPGKQTNIIVFVPKHIKISLR